MNTQKGWDFWAIFTLLLIIIGFMFSMNARINNIAMNMANNMATKADIARVEADIARVEADLKRDITDIRNLFIGHIGDGHKHKNRDRQPASEPPKSKSK